MKGDRMKTTVLSVRILANADRSLLERLGSLYQYCQKRLCYS